MIEHIRFPAALPCRRILWERRRSRRLLILAVPYRNNPVPRLAGFERLRIVIVICCGIRFGIPAALRNVGDLIDTAGILWHLCPLRRLRIAFCVLCRICLARLVL